MLNSKLQYRNTNWVGVSRNYSTATTNRSQSIGFYQQMVCSTRALRTSYLMMWRQAVYELVCVRTMRSSLLLLFLPPCLLLFVHLNTGRYKQGVITVKTRWQEQSVSTYITKYPFQHRYLVLSSRFTVIYSQ